MAEQKLTPTQKLKLAEAEITRLKQLIFTIKEEQQKHLNEELHRIQEQQYQLGYDEGFTEGSKLAAVSKSSTIISRWKLKG